MKLRLVNKRFDACPVRELFNEAHVSIVSAYSTRYSFPYDEDLKVDIEGLRQLAKSPHLRYVRCLKLSDAGGEECGKIVQDMLLRMPLLETFWWDDFNCNPEEAIHLPAKTLRVLHHSCPKIKSLDFGFHKFMEFQPGRAQPHVIVFTELAEKFPRG